MARSLGERLKELRSVVRLHTNWFTVVLLGRDAISETELQELEVYGKLPLDETLDYVKKSYVLGRLRATLKDKEYKTLNYEAVDEHAASASFTTLEEYALQHVKLHAADGIKGLTADLAAGAFNRLKGATQDTLNEASVRGIIRDQLAIAVIDKQNSQKVASNLAKELKTSWSRDWRRVAETELHRAKVMGSAQAIVNKLGIFQNSDGADSLVSIVPSPSRCEDCGGHFLDAQGNPRVFRLSQLLSQGSNGDPGVKHTSSGGQHNHWKTTLPPLHPRCGCRVVYIPRGMGWVSGKLRVVDEHVYVEELKKAVDQGNLGATIKPPGPKSAQGASTSVEAAASPPSMPGSPAPGNTPGPGAPKGAGSAIEWEYYPKEKGSPPDDWGGEQTESGSWRRPKGSGGGPSTPEQDSQKRSLKEQDAKQWNKGGKSADVVVNHLSQGEISHTRPLQQEDVGGTEGSEGDLGLGAQQGATLLVTIEGNGRGVMKPSQELSPRVLAGESYTEGCGTVPHGSQAQNEVDAFGFMTGLFGEGFCPPTTMREHEGKQKSVQQWQEGTHQAHKFIQDNKEPGDRTMGSVMMRMAADPVALKNKISDIVFADISMNNQDRHMGNLQFKTDDQGKITDVLPIDHGPTMANDFMGHKNALAKYMTAAGFKIKVSPETLDKSKKTTLGDLKRSMPGKKDWQCAQQLMRMRYTEHMMETDGHVDYHRLQPSLFSATEAIGRPDTRMWHEAPGMDYLDMENGRQLSHQQFENFVLDHVDGAAADSDHPDYEFAKEWKDKGLLMGPGAAADVEGHRTAGKHKEYENKVRAERAAMPAEQVETLTNRTEAHKPKNEDTIDVFAPTISASGAGKIPTTSEAITAQARPVQSEEGTVPAKKIKKGFSLYLADPNKLFGGLT
jgi:hypothetical protein